MRILLIQLKRIGDAILTTPALVALRETFPHAHLTLAIDGNAAGLAEALPADEILIRRRGGFGFWRKIVTGRFDATLDFTGNDRSALVAALSRAPHRLTYERFARKPLRRRIYTDFVDSSVRDRHTADHHTDLLQPLGIRINNVPSQLALPESAHTQAGAALAEYGITEPFTILHPGTARAEKYWPAECWARLIPQLRGPLVITGSADPSEQAHLARISAQLSTFNFQPPPANLAGTLSLTASAALIQRASLVIAVDSAPVHLADALGTPVVALFGPTNPYHWRPRGPRATVVTPATVITPHTPRYPMSEIRVESVLEAVRSLTEDPPSLQHPERDR